uniref:AB hydrolase-1 domain-containing protein n=1 Tax=Alexandrium catenella TaxID=2925 RepID=A0A7S1WKX9_ALECA
MIHRSSSKIDEDELLLKIQLALRDYWPHPVLEFSGYISTAWSGFWAVLPTAAPGRLEVLTLQDGGTVSLHWAEEPQQGGANRVALVIPGLNNSSSTSFVQQTMRNLQKEGFHAVAFNYRGTAGMDLTSPRFGCVDSWRDLPEVLSHLETAKPGAEFFAVGFSMGGGILLRHIGEAGAKTRLRAVVSIAAPVDYPAVGASLESNLKKRALNFAMTNGVKLFMLRSALRCDAVRSRLDVGRLLRARTMRQIEEASICPVHGYEDAREYYAKNSPAPLLERISVPTLVIHAEDDPVVSMATLPVEAMRRNPNIYVAVTRRGGHIGWGSGGLGAASWTDSMAVHFMQACASRSRL